MFLFVQKQCNYQQNTTPNKHEKYTTVTKLTSHSKLSLHAPISTVARKIPPGPRRQSRKTGDAFQNLVRHTSNFQPFQPGEFYPWLCIYLHMHLGTLVELKMSVYEC